MIRKHECVNKSEREDIFSVNMSKEMGRKYIELIMLNI